MGSFLENIIKNAGLGSILGGAAGQSEGSEGGSLQDILNEIGVGDGNFDTSAVTGEDEQEEVAAEETAAPGGINLQDILGKLGGAVAGGGISLQDILGKLGAGNAPVQEEEAEVEEEVEEVEEQAPAGGINIQDILGKVLAGGGLGSLATGAINIINIAKSVFCDRVGVMDEHAAAGDEFDEVK